MPQIGTNSVQLLTAISSAHCFDLQEFFSECNRILVDNGVIALSDSNNITITDPLKPNDNHLNEVFSEYYLNPNITITKNSYKDIEFPENYEYVYKTDINVSHTITANELLGWYQTLSHFQGYSSAEKQLSKEFVIEFTDKLRDVLKTDDLSTKEVSISYTYFIAMGRKVNQIVLYKTFRGHKLPPFLKNESIEYAVNYTPTQFNRITITYPKCGSVWAEMLIKLIINSGNTVTIDPKITVNTLFEMNGRDIWGKLTSLSGGQQSDDVIPLTTHLCYELLPYNKSAKYLLVLRNPKDVFVSFYYFLLNIFKFDYNLSEFFKLWIRGDTQYGDYFAFVKQYWIHYKCEQNFKILLYEEMNRDIKPCIQIIAKFLGQKYVNRLSNDNKLIDEIIEKSGFNAMKEFHKMDGHFRTGVVGDWRSHLTKDESDLIDKRVEEEWMGTGLELLWKEEMKWI